MNVAFIVVVNLDDISSVMDVAGDIEDDLNNAGMEVITVHPWARPTLTQGQPALNVPTTTTNQNNTNLL